MAETSASSRSRSASIRSRNSSTRSQTTACAFSDSFDDAEKLLAHAEAIGLEGIVSKRRDRPYRSVRCDWVKVKSRAWREANKDRHELFRNRR
jgi:ATP-dependent DNA ligase